MMPWFDDIDFSSLHPQSFTKHPLMLSPPSSLQKISQIFLQHHKQKQAQTETQDLNIHDVLANSE